MIARSYAAVASRAQAIADIDLVVNICTAAILFLGLGRIVQRFGVIAGLVLNPLLMVVAFLATAFAPTLFMIQALQVVRRVAQYAIARPSREICFTVVDQSSRYKAKNVIDTVVYRFGDVSSAWVQAGLRPMGYASSRRNVRCTFRICKRNLDFDAVREAGVDRSFHLPVFTPAT